MKKPLTQEERKLIIRMAAAQILGVVKTNDGRKTKLFKKRIIDALDLIGITQSEMYDTKDVQRRVRDEAGKAGDELMYRSFRK